MARPARIKKRLTATFTAPDGSSRAFTTDFAHGVTRRAVDVISREVFSPSGIAELVTLRKQIAEQLEAESFQSRLTAFVKKLKAAGIELKDFTITIGSA